MKDYVGLVVQFEKPSDVPMEEIYQLTINFNQLLETLPGFRSAMYHNINDEHFCAVCSFETEADTDSAIESIRPNLSPSIPNIEMYKAGVIPGNILPDTIEEL